VGIIHLTLRRQITK